MPDALVGFLWLIGMIVVAVLLSWAGLGVLFRRRR